MRIWTIGELEDGMPARSPDGAPAGPKSMLDIFKGLNVARSLNRECIRRFDDRIDDFARRVM